MAEGAAYNFDMKYGYFDLIEDAPHSVKGTMYLIKEYGLYYVAWRQDRRRRWAETISYIYGLDTLEEAQAEMERLKTEYTPYIHKRSKPRDSQRQKVYDWEFLKIKSDVSATINQPMSRADCVAFVHHVYSALGIPLDKRYKVVFKSNRQQNARCSNPRKMLILPTWAQTRKIILHEMAHQLVFMNYRWKVASHGQEFVGYAIMMYHLFGNIDLNYLIESARARKIKVKMPENFTYRGQQMGLAA